MEMFEYINIMNQPYDIFYTANTSSPLHWHYYSEILYVTSGSIRIICNNREAVLHAGDLCYFYPLQLHSVLPDTDCTEAVRYAVIKFNIQNLDIPHAYIQSMYDCFVHRTAEDDFCIIVHDLPDADGLTGNIVREYESSQGLHMLAVQAGIYLLLISVYRRTGNKKRPLCPRTEHNMSFYHILEYIDSHSAEPLEVQELARRCHMSYSHFARLFRENYGRSCKEYILYIRLNKAWDLLINSQLDIDYIAQETGFYDCSHFIRQYKKWRGITPRQERLNSTQ